MGSVAELALAQLPSHNFSLNALLQSESLEEIKRNVEQLVVFTSTLPSGQNGTLSTHANIHDLDVLIRSSGSILSSLNRLIALKDQTVISLEERGDVAWLDRANMEEPRRHALVCHDCNARTTPRWRRGPDGPKTLCNVCGLVYRKHMQRHGRF